MPDAIQTKKDFSCGGVVWNPDERSLLLIHVENLAGKKVWTFPKGHPEANETDEQAALREVVEETGWRCSIVRPITDVDYFYTQNHIRFHKTVRWFLMRPEEKVGTFSPDEILDCRWSSPAEAAQSVTYGSDKELLKKLSPLF